MAARVLIVEDDELLREMYASKFELEGYDVLTANDGEEGLKTAISARPDLIILDNLMPLLTGIQLLERYRAAKPKSRAVVIFLSNKSALGDVNRAKQLGAVDYLIKSQLTPRELVAIVRRRLRAKKTDTRSSPA